VTLAELLGFKALVKKNLEEGGYAGLCTDDCMCTLACLMHRLYDGLEHNPLHCEPGYLHRGPHCPEGATGCMAPEKDWECDPDHCPH
jgi:hypothetical protein